MDIGPVYNDQCGQGRVETEKAKNGNWEKAGPAGDRVEISTEARMKLAALADQALHEISKSKSHDSSKATGKPLTQVHTAQKQVVGDVGKTARIECVRDRVESGFYNQPDVKKRIAERLATEFWKSSGKGK